MKINNETKVGVLAIVALALLIIGFNFLRGDNIFSRSRKIYMVFDKLNGLAKSNEVKINGYVIGTVYDLGITDRNMNGIVATINLSEEINIPIDSKASVTASLIGGSHIDIQKGQSGKFLSIGDTLRTLSVPGMMDALKSQLTPTLSKLGEGLDSVKLLIGNLNQTLSENTRNELQGTIHNLYQSTSAISRLLENPSSPLVASLNNVKSITGNLSKNNDSITATINSAKKAAEKLANLDLQTTINNFNESLTDLKSIVKKLNSTDGSLGALINDKQLYNRLSNTVLSAEILMDDLRSHPKRYVNFSVFGKKDKGGALTSPSIKDTTPVSPK